MQFLSFDESLYFDLSIIIFLDRSFSSTCNIVNCDKVTEKGLGMKKTKQYKDIFLTGQHHCGKLKEISFISRGICMLVQKQIFGDMVRNDVRI